LLSGPDTSLKLGEEPTIFLFVFFAIWRFILFLTVDAGDLSSWSFAWGATYQIVAIWGAVAGLIVSQSWGGWKSTFGKALLLFSIGLLFQSFGQTVSNYYVYYTGEVPYPGIGDIGFFGSIIFYISGIFLLAKVAGVKTSIKSFANKAQAILIPAVMVISSYLFFLRGYQYDLSNPIKTFLDFGYPIYQAIYVGIAILTLVLSRKYLGGMMRRPVLLFLFALIMQYIADFTFLYQTSRGLYIPGGINDFMYLVAYFIMATALIYTGSVFKKIHCQTLFNF